MAEFHFVTTGSYTTPVDAVWKVITDIERLPEWFPGFEKATLRGADRTLRVGQVVDCRLAAPMGYRLNFTLTVADLTPPTMMRLDSAGDLVGWGQWDLRQDGPKVGVTYTWHVGMNKPVFNTIANIGFVRAILARNHEIVMKKGFAALGKLATR
jgi:uncharacterized protein YndB with AHSA1/START domain